MIRYVLFVMRSILLFTMALFSLGGCGNNSGSTQATSNLTAETIISRMREAYANCDTYQDTGVMSVTYTQNSINNFTDQLSFSTAFIRSGRFRFEYKDLSCYSPPSYIVWRNGEDILSWWDIDYGIQTEDSLGMAIAGTTGVSHGLSDTIPSLLISDQVGLYYLILNAQRLDDDVLDGVNCYRIYYYNSGDDQVTMWIDSEKYLIRRIEHRYYDNFSTTTIYNPVVDGPVSDDVLAFDPPLANGDMGDRVVITNITPTSVSSAQATTFTLEVSYTLASHDSGVLSVSGQDITVSKGTGTQILKVAATPVDTDSYSYFMVRVNLYDQQSYRLAYHKKFIIVFPSAKPSMSSNVIMRELSKRQKENQSVTLPLSAR